MRKDQKGDEHGINGHTTHQSTRQGAFHGPHVLLFVDLIKRAGSSDAPDLVVVIVAAARADTRVDTAVIPSAIILPARGAVARPVCRAAGSRRAARAFLKRSDLRL